MIDITPDPGPLLAAAIVAAITRLDEESRAAAAVPREPPVPGRWVASGRPRAVAPPAATRVARSAPVRGVKSAGETRSHSPEV